MREVEGEEVAGKLCCVYKGDSKKKRFHGRVNSVLSLSNTSSVHTLMTKSIVSSHSGSDPFGIS